MQITIKVNIIPLIGALFMTIITALIFSGLINSIVSFSSIATEMGIAFLSTFMTVVFASLSFKLVKKYK